MEDLLWNLFFLTGDPRTYLLLKSGETELKRKPEELHGTQPAPPQEFPSPSL